MLPLLKLNNKKETSNWAIPEIRRTPSKEDIRIHQFYPHFNWKFPIFLPCLMQKTKKQNKTKQNKQKTNKQSNSQFFDNNPILKSKFKPVNNKIFNQKICLSSGCTFSFWNSPIKQ